MIMMYQTRWALRQQLVAVVVLSAMTPVMTPVMTSAMSLAMLPLRRSVWLAYAHVDL